MMLLFFCHMTLLILQLLQTCAPIFTFLHPIDYTVAGGQQATDLCLLSILLMGAMQVLGYLPNPYIRFKFDHSIMIRHHIHVNWKMPHFIMYNCGYSTCSETALGVGIHLPVLLVLAIAEIQQTPFCPAHTRSHHYLCFPLPLAHDHFPHPWKKHIQASLSGIGRGCETLDWTYMTLPITYLIPTPLQIYAKKFEQKNETVPLHTTGYCCADIWWQYSELCLLQLFQKNPLNSYLYTLTTVY